ncbi:MAG TPA: hypothetical protein VKD43_17800 [Xanthobacteraceae bacterium]|nr:hypothetical protein [Xanthobacteraceae bacterium]
MPQRIADVLLAVPLAATALVMLFVPRILRDLQAVYLPALLTAWFTIGAARQTRSIGSKSLGDVPHLRATERLA